MRVRIRVVPRVEEPAPSRDSIPRFEPLPPSRGTFQLALSLSLALHLAGGAMAPPALSFLDQWTKPLVDFRQAQYLPRDAMPLLIEAPREPLLVRMPKLAKSALPKLRKIRTKASAQQSSDSAPRPVQTRTLADIPRQAPVATAILLQPSLKLAEITEIPDLRSLAVWTGLSPQSRERPIAVGQVEPVRSELAAALRTAPDIPLPDPVISSVAAPRIEPPPEMKIRPKLILPPSGSSPFQAEVPRLDEPQIPPGSTMVGEAAAIIALSTMAAKPDDILPIPPGSLVVIGSGGNEATLKPPQVQTALPEAAQRPIDSAPKQPVERATARKPPPELAKTATPEPQKPVIASAPQATVRSAPANSAAVEVRGPQVNPADSPRLDSTNHSTQTGTMRSMKTLSGEIHMRTAPDGRVSLTYPSNGNFDVVVVESALPENLAQFGRSLSGTPVHTVFLNVGSATEWVMQYCLPGRAANDALQQGMVVTLDSPAPLKAPYVLEARLPADSAWRTSGYQVFHGILNLAGRLEQLRVVRAGGAASLLLESLRSWMFRPASAGGVPKTVEVLLVIPPLGTP